MYVFYNLTAAKVSRAKVDKCALVYTRFKRLSIQMETLRESRTEEDKKKTKEKYIKLEST